ncbi:hypothetical protein Tsubulata_007479 [Turnera subulata]|uniref:dolichol kinase n=1 Tax=Turnera subulata TaxID=218843 RepID=A0A9Q0FDX0_9ROSI|nr:hypothetical protein Tsubulata_007479 [Turnera subulata]
MAAVPSSPPLLNGERAVVSLFIVAVLCSLPSSLLSHGAALSLLSLLALSVEILADRSPSPLSQFKTRPGASSGILLGAVTLPAVLLSKLIQLSRAIALREINRQEVDYMAMQYWAATASSLAVLVFLRVVMWRSGSANRWGALFRLWFAFVPIGALLCVVLLNTGVPVAPVLLWFVFHGFAAVKLVQHLLNTFPSCASIGEALLVTVGLVLYFGDMLASTVTKLHGFLALSELMPIRYGIKRSEISIITQGLILGLLLFPIIFKYVLHILNRLLTASNTGWRAHYHILKSIVFFPFFAFLMIVVVPSWMQLVHDFEVHPLLWVVKFIFSEPVKRLSICSFWVLAIYVSVQLCYNISKNSKLERILLRKYYHLLAVIMFLPAVILEPLFLNLAFGAALAGFLSLEVIRVWRIWPLGELIHEFMNAFTDHRDSDLLIVSHFSLLLGCALPIWMSSGYNDRPLAPFAGILSLGIGDTMASMVGHKYGVLRWSKSGKKTIEGTAAGVTSVLAFCLVLLPILTSTGYILTQHWISILLAVIVSGLLEAYTAQLDNAFIPLVFYGLLCL